MKIVAIKDMSAGNDTVGDMWKETKIFDGKEPVENVMAWVGDRTTNVVLTIPDEYNTVDLHKHLREIKQEK